MAKEPRFLERPLGDGSRLRRAFDALATKASNAAGKPLAFTLAIAVVLAWLVTGPLFGFSDTWQLFINTGTTIMTFLMVFLIQHTQNKDTRALQMKLNELIAAQPGASNRLIDVEELDEDELEALHDRFQDLQEDAQRLRAGAVTSVEKQIPGRGGPGSGARRKVSKLAKAKARQA